MINEGNPGLLKHSSYPFDDSCVVIWTASKAHITRTKGIKICFKEQQMMSLVTNTWNRFETNTIYAYTMTFHQSNILYIPVERKQRSSMKLSHGTVKTDLKNNNNIQGITSTCIPNWNRLQILPYLTHSTDSWQCSCFQEHMK